MNKVHAFFRFENSLDTSYNSYSLKNEMLPEFVAIKLYVGVSETGRKPKLFGFDITQVPPGQVTNWILKNLVCHDCEGGFTIGDVRITPCDRFVTISDRSGRSFDGYFRYNPYLHYGSPVNSLGERRFPSPDELVKLIRDTVKACCKSTSEGLISH